MSLDRSLKGKGGLLRHRNVLKRAERIAILQDEERWDESQSVFGLPKVAVRRASTRASRAKAAAQAEQASEEAQAGQEASSKEQTSQT